jgi:predicted permease
MSRGPALARALLRVVLRGYVARAVVDDLETEFLTITARMGSHAARRWYWRQTMWAVGPAMQLWLPMRHHRFDDRPAPYTSPTIFRRIPEQIGVHVRFAFRQLMRHPGVTITVVLTMAVGIAANAAVFSVVSGVLLRPLPYHEPDRLGFVRVDQPSVAYHPLVTGAEYAAVLNASTVADAAAITTEFQMRLDSDEGSSSVTVVGVTANLFRVLGVSPHRGRDFTSEEGGAQVALLTWDFWRERYDEDPDVIGSTVDITGRPYTVIGVLPPSFRLFLGEGTGITEHVDAFTPAPVGLGNTTFAAFRTVLRLSPGASFADTRRELATVAARLAQDHPAAFAAESRTYRVTALRDDLVAPVRPAILALVAVAIIVLAIACLNVAGLLLARAAVREREFALRAALGASRGQLLTHAFTEAAIMTTAATLLGIGFGAWMLRALLSQWAVDLPRVSDVGLDGTALGISIALAGLATAAFGLLPALHAARSDPQAGLRAGSTRFTAPSHARHVLIVGQIAMSSTLLIGAGLMLRTMDNLRSVPLGFESANLLTAKLVAPLSRDRTPYWRFYDTFISQLETVPGVQRASAVSRTPLAEFSDVDIVTFATPGEAPEDSDRRADMRWVMPGYFVTVGTALLEGRAFVRDDFENVRPVVIVDARVARSLWPRQSAVGEQLFVPASFGGEPVQATVVGVVEHAQVAGVRDEGRPQVYRPLSHAAYGVVTLAVRAGGDPTTIFWAIGAVADALGARNLYAERPMADIVRETTAGTRLAASLIVAVAVMAVASSALGLYSLLAFVVARSRRETGIRIALGAHPERMVRMHVRHGLRLTGAGLAVGGGMALLAGRAVESLLFGVASSDAITWIGTMALFFVVAATASYFPSRAAATVDPTTALRAE